jgi:hypothetical protein
VNSSITTARSQLRGNRRDWGEPLTYHDEIADADRRVDHFLQQSAAILPAGQDADLPCNRNRRAVARGRFWNSGSDWAVLVETTEDQPSRTLVQSKSREKHTCGGVRGWLFRYAIRAFAAGVLSGLDLLSAFAAQDAHETPDGVLLPTVTSMISGRVAP